MNKVLSLQALASEENAVAFASSVSVAFSCKKFSSVSLLIC
ncbi:MULTISPECIES: class III lanthipeptide [unclassified Gardnerella]